MSLREASRKANLSASSLSAIEKGRSSPTLATMQRILQALGTNFADFFGTPAAPDLLPVFRSDAMATIRDNEGAGNAVQVTIMCPLRY